MNYRTKKINQAILAAKKRDDYTCIICGRNYITGHAVEGAHILPRNVGFKLYNPADVNCIMTLCSEHHSEFDRNHNPHEKIKYLQKKRIYRFANKIKLIIGENDVHEN